MRLVVTRSRYFSFREVQIAGRVAVIIILLCVCCTSFAQDNSPVINAIIEEITEYMAENEESENIDIDQIYDDLQYLYEHKINLNTATRDQLERLPFLSKVQIENILAYVYITHGMRSIYEIQLIDGIDYFIQRLLLHFVFVGDMRDESMEWNTKEIFGRIRHKIFSRIDADLEQRRGYAENKYLGSPLYEQFRYAFGAGKNRIQAGIVAEKDKGEQFWGSYRKGFDSYSAYMQVDKLWKFSRIVIGDFRATFGQGLIMNGAFSAGKSSNVLKVNPSQSGLNRKSSSDEYNFFRGIGATAQLDRLSFTALYSFRYYDASVDTLGNTFSSLYTSGIFRTSKDWSKRDNLSMRVFALNTNYRFDRAKIGVTLYGNCLSMSMLPEDKPYRRYSFRGDRQAAASVDYYWSLGRFVFWGETALTDRLAVATINGLSMMPTSNLNIVFLHRYYSRSYDLFFAKSFGKSSNVSNEDGVYLGFEVNPVKKWKLSTYADMFKFPYMKYRVSAPSKGFDAFAQVDFLPTRYLNMYLRYRLGDKEQDFVDRSLPTRQILNYEKQSLRYNLEYKYKNIVFRSKVETNAAKSPMESYTYGFGFVQDIAYNTLWHNLSVTLHYVFFDAPNYANRLYFYEPDILYSMSTPILYGIGNRYAINLKMSVVRNLFIYLHFSQTIYTDKRTKISSGLEEIKGNIMSNLKVALNWKF
ncbi:MAG: helix-hairpin-helix domain-containing protein [Bacteroidota bacterium]